MGMKLKYIVLPILFFIVFISCSETDDLGDKRSTRTVFVYMVASSNLEGNLTRNIADMIAVATPENLNGGNLVVFFSKSKEEAELFEIKEGANGVVTRHHLRDYTDKSAISPQVMREILDEVVSLYPSDNYGMILSSHGSAWMPAGFRTLRSFGEEAGKYMEINELADALPNHFFNFLLFDACSMGSVECVYELRDKAEYIISSPSEIMDVGFPYQKVLPLLFRDTPGMNQIADEFHNFYTNYQHPYGNISVVKTGELEELAGVTRTIVSAAGGEEATSNLLSLFPNLQILTYYSEPTCLYDFGDVIQRLATDEQYSQFQVALDKAVIEKRSTGKTYIQELWDDRPVSIYSGLSVYPFQKELVGLNTWYKQLDWYKAVYE
jgi:hypothetical protein